jgi:hypothetical protein
MQETFWIPFGDSPSESHDVFICFVGVARVILNKDASYANDKKMGAFA